MLSEERRLHRFLDFSEANIVNVNRQIQDKESFLQRLCGLQAHTTDPVLLRDLKSLHAKISELSEQEFSALMQDARDPASAAPLFPPDYELPNFSEISL